MLHGKNAARIFARVLKGGGLGMTEAAIQYALEKRYKEGIDSGRIKKPTLRQIREAKAAAKKTAAKKKGYAKQKPVKDKVTRKPAKVGGKFYKMKAMVIKPKKAKAKSPAQKRANRKAKTPSRGRSGDKR